MSKDTLKKSMEQAATSIAAKIEEVVKDTPLLKALQGKIMDKLGYKPKAETETAATEEKTEATEEKPAEKKMDTPKVTKKAPAKKRSAAKK